MLRGVDGWDSEHFTFGAADALPNGGPATIAIETGANGPTATVPDAHLLFTAQFTRAGADLVLHGEDGKAFAVHDYFAGDTRARLLSPEGATLSADVVDALVGPQAPGQYAQAGTPQASAQAVGRVVHADSDATIVRNGVAIAAHAGDAILKGDVLQTISGTIGVTFNDGSTLNLTANTRLVVNEFVYDPNGAANSQLLNLVQGSLTFISGEVAHNGDMKIGTPVATMGIRGTVGGVTTANDGTVHFYVSQSATGAVILDSRGVVIANVVQDGPLIVVRPVGPLQVLAEEVQKSPAQLATELSALQQIVSIQSVGQQIIQQYFQQNPNNNPNPQSTDHPHTQFQVDLHTNDPTTPTDPAHNDQTGTPPDTATVHVVVTNPDGTKITTLTDVPIPPNLAPLAFAPLEQTAHEDIALVFSTANLNAISVFDVDTNVLMVTLTGTHGLISLNGVAGLTFSAGDGTGDAAMTFSGTQAAINAALDGMSFKPDADYNGQASLTVKTSDGNSTTAPEVIAITVEAVNDAPVIAQDSSPALTYTENGAAAAIDTALMISDIDSVHLTGAKVTISGNFHSGEDVLAFTDQNGITGSYEDGVLTLSGSASVADYQAALRSVTYANTSDNPSSDARTISFQVDDGSDANNLSNVVTATVAVVPVNDAPVLDYFNLTVVESGVTVLTTADFHVTDPDNSAFIFTVQNVIGGHFEVSSDGPPAFFALFESDAPQVVTFTSDDIANGRVSFVADGGEAPPSFTITVSDGSAESAAVSPTVSFTNVNTAPVLDGFTLTVAEGGTTVLTTADFQITDPDSTAFLFTVENVTGGEFQVLTGESWVAAPTGGFTAADIAAGLVRFVHDGGEAAPAFTVSVSDFAAASAAVDPTVNFTNVNDAPVISQESSPTLDFTENQSPIPIDGRLTLSDADGTILTGATVAITGNFHGGEDVLAFTNQQGISGNYDSETGVLTLTGFASVEAYQTALRSVAYGNTSDDPSADARTVSFQVSDGGAVNGLSNVVTATVNVTPINDAPAITSRAGAPEVAEDTPLTLGGEVAISVADPDTGELTVTVSASHGAISLNQLAGLVFSAGDGTADATMTFSGSQPAINQALDGLTFNPAANYNGDAAITVTASDGIADPVEQVVSVTVTPVDDAPVITSNNGGASATLNVAENTTAVTTVQATDVDSENLSYSIAGGADAAKFTIDANGVLSFVTAPNYEHPADSNHNDIYTVEVQTSDGSLDDTQTLHIRVTDVNEAPRIVSNNGGDTATVSVAENHRSVTTVRASDPDFGDHVRFSIVDGEDSPDAGLFTINQFSGELSFRHAPDFENPADAGGNNSYVVKVRATDGDGLTDTQIVTVNVTDVNEAPVIDGPRMLDIDAAENQTAVTTIAANDPDAGATVTYTLVGSQFASPDASKFTIDANTGVLTFLSAPDFEAPGDSNGNNIYTVMVDASDGRLHDYQTLHIHITDVNEAPIVDLDTNQASIDYETVAATNGGQVAVFGDHVSVSDVDNTTLQSASISLQSVDPNDDIFFDLGALPDGEGAAGDGHNGSLGGLTWSINNDCGALVITIAGEATSEVYGQFLAAVRFSSTSQDTSDRTVTVTVNDGSLDSAAAIATIHIDNYIHWDSASGGDWFEDSSNWTSSEHVPGTGQSQDNVSITQPQGETVTLGQDSSIHDLTVGVGVILDVTGSSGEDGPSGNLHLSGNTVNAGLIETTGGEIAFDGDVANSGAIEASNGGRISFNGQIDGLGTLTSRDRGLLQFAATFAGAVVLSGGDVEFNSAVAANGIVTFDSAGSALWLDDASAFAGHIAGFRLGDLIDFGDFGSADPGSLSFSYNPDAHDLVVSYAAQPQAVPIEIHVGVTGDYSAQDFAFLPDGNGGNRLTFTDFWTGAVSNDLNDPDNWSLGHVPDRNTSVTYGSGSSSAFDLGGGSFKVAGLILGDGASLSIVNGIIDIGSLDNSGILTIGNIGQTFTQVELDLPAVNHVNASFSVTGNSELDIHDGFDNFGSFVASDGASVFAYGSVTNESGGTFDVLNGATFEMHGQFDNHGSALIDPPSIVTTFDLYGDLNNSGGDAWFAVSGANGRANIYGDVHNGEGATIEVSDGGYFYAAQDVEGLGAFNIAGGTMEFHGRVDSSVTVSFGSGTDDILMFDDALDFAGLISGFGTGDRIIDSGNVDAGSFSVGHAEGGTFLHYTENNGADTVTLAVDGNYSNSSFAVGYNGGALQIGFNDAPTISGVASTGGLLSTGLTPTAAGYLVASHDLINGLGGSAGFGESYLPANDDGSTGAINIKSVFGDAGLNFFGTPYTSLYINNNGSITFGGATSEYIPGAINAGINNPIIAPFWADVDTRGGPSTVTPGGHSTGSNLVWYDLDPTNHVMTVTWDDVGYYSEHRSQPNAFQLQLIGLDNGNFDIVFRYEAINWTTGDVSQGAVARAGYSAGDGNSAHYYELSQSGNQAAMLDLDSTRGNTGIAGVDVFQVQSGNVSVAATISGAIGFTDADASDTHTATAQAGDGNYIGAFALDDPNNDGSHVTEANGAGSVEWHFNLTNTEINGILANGAATQSYDVAIADNHGASVMQTLSISFATNAADTFHFNFSTHLGADTILNFNTGADTIVLEGYDTIHDQEDILAALSSNAADALHGDAVINLGHGDSVTIAGVTQDYIQHHIGLVQIAGVV